MKSKISLYFHDYCKKEAEEEYRGDGVNQIHLCFGKNRFTIIPSDKAAYFGGTCYRGIAYRFD